MINRYRLFLIAWVLIPLMGWGQDIYQQYNIYRNPFRVFINHITWNIAPVGYGQTTYKHDLEGYHLFVDGSNLYILDKQSPTYDPAGGEQIIIAYHNWLNAPGVSPELIPERTFEVPKGHIDDPIYNPILQSIKRYNGDSVFINGVAKSIPITASAHVEFFNFKLGAGYTYERQWIKTLPMTFGEEVVLPDYTPNFTVTNFNRFYGILGYRFYEYWHYSAIVDLQIGKIWYGKKAFDPNAIRPNINLNAGITLEQRWSEYFALTLRPSFDWKRYEIFLPDGAGPILHQHNSFHLQMGVSINIPEIPRSHIKGDHVQLKHVVTDPATGRLMEVRGQPFWKVQNPKVGENHRKLWRYKWRNKHKLHPY